MCHFFARYMYSVLEQIRSMHRNVHHKAYGSVWVMELEQEESRNIIS